MGTITGFGGVFVNGIKFETGSSSYEVDDDGSLSQDDLAIGMKVKVKGTVNADGRTGTATSIEYDDDIEGPVAGLTDDGTFKRFTIFGMNVQAELGATIFDDGLSYANLNEGDIVEVSGYFDYVSDTLIATYIEPQSPGDDEFEVKGTVTAYDPGVSITIELLGGASQTFDLDGSTILDFSGDPVDQFVEVKLDSGTLVATAVEVDDKDYLDDDDDEVKLKGILTTDGSDYLINGVVISVSDPAVLAALLGTYVEVEGRLVGGVLVVSEVERKDGDHGVKGARGTMTATDARNGTVIVDLSGAGSVTVISNNATMIHKDDQALNLSDLTSSQCPYIEAEGADDGTGKLVAFKIECENSVSAYEAEGPIAGFDAGLGTVTILTATYTVTDGITSFENVVPATATALFAALSVGEDVEVRDNAPAVDGVADRLKLDD